MKKVTVIYDGLVKKDYFEEGLKLLEKQMSIEVEYFSWFSDLNKDEFQEKIHFIEKNGPDFYEPSLEMLNALRDTDYLFAHIAPINKKMLEVCQNLELISVCRGGTENIDLKYCYNNGIPVLRYVKNARATAEFTLGLMLSVTRNLHNSHAEIQKNKWTKNFFNDGNRSSLNELKVGIVGLGHIGTELARILIGMDVDVMAYHVNLTEERKKEINLPLKYVELDALLEKSDLISLHLRLDSSTKNLISRESFKKMKKNSYLINTSRADIINESDLLQALDEQEILGAALDVFWDEPLRNHKLLHYENVLLTPHIAGDTDVISRAPKLMLKEVIRYLNTGNSSMKIKDKYMH